MAQVNGRGCSLNACLELTMKGGLLKPRATLVSGVRRVAVCRFTSCSQTSCVRKAEGSTPDPAAGGLLMSEPREEPVRIQQRISPALPPQDLRMHARDENERMCSTSHLLTKLPLHPRFQIPAT